MSTLNAVERASFTPLPRSQRVPHEHIRFHPSSSSFRPNRSVMEHLGHPRRVLISLDVERRIVLIEPTYDDNPDGYAVTKMGAAWTTGTAKIRKLIAPILDLYPYELIGEGLLIKVGAFENERPDLVAKATRLREQKVLTGETK